LKNFRKNRVKALYGYWTHCFYSCDVKVYEDYIANNKNIPTLSMDECLRPSNNNSNNNNTNEDQMSIHSTSSLTIRHNNSNTNSKQLSEDRSSKTGSIPNSTLLWKALSLPQDSAQVCYL
jgi:hypothetical protein